jgi:hypothetical protein
MASRPRLRPRLHPRLCRPRPCRPRCTRLLPPTPAGRRRLFHSPTPGSLLIRTACTPTVTRCHLLRLPSPCMLRPLTCRPHPHPRPRASLARPFRPSSLATTTV